MSEKKEAKIVRKGIVIALGIICVILVASLGGVIAAYTFVINDKNNTISSLDTQVSLLKSNVTNLQNQINSILNGSSSIGDIIISDPSAWVNNTVLVGGIIQLVPKSTGFSWPPWDYYLSSNGSYIGVSWQGTVYNEENVTVLGVVTGGHWTTFNLVNGTSVLSGPVVYFIEAESIGLL